MHRRRLTPCLINDLGVSWLLFSAHLYAPRLKNLRRLVHNTQGEHNERFHRIWNELRDEWVTLQSKGFTGEGFLGQGKTLGGRHIPNDELRRRARAAAIERQKSVTSSNLGHRLGGSSTGGSSYGGFYGRPDPAVLAAAAANRSSTSSTINTSSCGAGSKVAEQAGNEALRNGYRTTADMSEEDEIAIQNALIELMEEEEERKLNGLPTHQSGSGSSTAGLVWDPINGLQAASSSGTSSSGRSTAKGIDSSSMAPVPLSSKPSSAAGSHSSRATSKRPASFQTSGSSGSSRRMSDALGAYPIERSQAPVPPSSTITSSTKRHDSWPCPTCTLLNQGSAQRCEACDQPRPPSKITKSRTPTASRQPARSQTSISSYVPAPASYSDRPLGWNCRSCGTFMESQWWTCSFCGTMKESS